jgi:3,4-dihydroxy 2-butanone 4-phosphate synthase/GTP cyclohydrolase II
MKNPRLCSSIEDLTTDSIEDALTALALGSLVVVMDNEDRENEGDLIMAAQYATPDKIAFMVRWTSGILCAALPGDRLDRLELPLMCANNSDSMHTAFTVSTDYRRATTTGISASDRALTFRALVDPASSPDDFSRPGHVFPLRAAVGGVLQRPGHTEAAVDLARLAGLREGGVLAELVNPDGSMQRFAQAVAFARLHALPIITIEQLIRYRVCEATRPKSTSMATAVPEVVGTR